MRETPMMKQYMGFKRQYPDKVLLFRMGDFFETFGDDAETTAKALNITLTTRDKKSDPTPLAGFPHHALEQYLPKLIHGGYSVVIVDQIEDPKMAKGIVKRAVTRVVTPGTLDGDHAASVKNSYLLAVFRDKKKIGIALADITTGEFKITEVADEKQNVDAIMNSYEPVEVLLMDNEKEFNFNNLPVQILESKSLKFNDCEELIKEFYKVQNLDALGIEGHTAAVCAIAMVVSYVQETQKMSPEHLTNPSFFTTDGYMVLDHATIRNLELVQNSTDGGIRNSLFHILDKTSTRMGKRLLHFWILNPLLDKSQIEERYKAVKYFYDDYEKLLRIRQIMTQVNDLERMVGKIGLNRANGRDYKAIETSLDQAYEIYELLKDLISESELLKFNELLNNNGDPSTGSGEPSLKRLRDLISATIKEDPPVSVTEGHFILSGVDIKVDELRALSGDSKTWVKEFAEKEREKTGIPSLKIGFNRVFGYYIEITKAHQDRVPDTYIRKQTLVNCERYITQELKEKEEIILGAEEKLAAMEYEIFQKFRTETLPYLEKLQLLGREIAQLDVLMSFAFVAVNNGYVQPELYEFGENDGVIDFKNGRHPVIEAISDEPFISNDTCLNVTDRRMSILTGPNMSGKSTYIRQIALIVLLAQIGCYVPADSAKIALVDRIFTRVGASDDLSRGRSTFMVEMDEAANIINNATKNSLVILDEIGRGTSTYDGVSIAWSLAEYLANQVAARTLFATHYHELLKLVDEIPDAVKNLNVQVEEDLEKDEVIFLRKIEEGGTDRSYGIYVAKMAGLPDQIIERAKEILYGFEQTAMFGDTPRQARGNKDEKLDIIEKEKVTNKKEDTPLYSFDLFTASNNEIMEEIRELDLNGLTPLEIMNKVSEWKKKLGN